MIFTFHRFVCILNLFCLGVLAYAQETAVESSPPGANDNTWSSDYPAALDQARTDGKLVLLDFTGTDWCVWCRRLRAEVFLQKPFVDYARDHLILVELDFPRHKPQSEGKKKQNQTLAERYGVSGYPTIVLVDSSGRELGRTGYIEGGAKTFVRALKRFAADATRAATKTP